MNADILIESSARHVHLDAEALRILFGENFKLTVKKELSQKGQFLSHQKVDIVGEKSFIKNVSVLGPLRKKVQVEISKTDDYKLSVCAPVRESGDLEFTPGCKLIGPNGEMEIQSGVIVAKRHIHSSLSFAKELGLINGQIVLVKVESQDRSLIFDDVVVRVDESFSPAMHIDTDEANAANITSNVYGKIIIKKLA